MVVKPLFPEHQVQCPLLRNTEYRTDASQLQNKNVFLLLFLVLTVCFNIYNINYKICVRARARAH